MNGSRRAVQRDNPCATSTVQLSLVNRDQSYILK
jgi:hypothetical protein